MALDNNKFFIISLFIVGIILLIIHFIIDANSGSCTNVHRITQINKGFLVIAVIFVTSIIAYYVMDCKLGRSVYDIRIFLVFYIIFGIVIISLSSSGISSVDGDCDAVKNIFIVTLMIGILIVVVSIVYLLYLYRFNLSKIFEGSKQPVRQPYYFTPTSRLPQPIQENIYEEV